MSDGHMSDGQKSFFCEVFILKEKVLNIDIMPPCAYTIRDFDPQTEVGFCKNAL